MLYIFANLLPTKIKNMNRFLVSIFIVLMPIIGWGQFNAEPHIITYGTLGLNYLGDPLEVADLNSDGINDYIVGTRYDLSWYTTASEGGTFLNQNIITTNIEDVNSVSVGDIDMDGNLDILISTNNKLAYYRNIAGNGQEWEEVFIFQSLHCRSSFLVDIDGDDDLDILFTGGNSFNYNSGWLENLDGKGTMSAFKVILSDFGDSSIVPFDKDNDGDLDILYASYLNERIGWLENVDGKGTFLNYFIGNHIYTIVKATDINGDGLQDAIFGDVFEDKLAWFENLEDQATFGTKNDISGTFTRISSIDTGDIDADGDQDLVVTSPDLDSHVFIYENSDGLGGFLEQEVDRGLERISVVKFIDSDKDNDLDIFTISKGKLSFFENTNGDGTYKVGETLLCTPSFFDYVLDDFIGDKSVDVSVLLKNVKFMENVGEEVFNNDLMIARENVDFNIRKARSANVDQDEEKEIVVLEVKDAANSPTKLTWFDVDESLTEYTIGTTEVTVFFKDFLMVDIENDGDMDIVYLRSDHNVGWYENTNGLGEFSLAKTISGSIADPLYIHTADCDGDNDQDIIIAFDNGHISWFENLDGQGDFSTRRIITIGELGQISAIQSSDVDNDGDIDLGVSTSGNGEIRWFENLDGEGNFGNGKIISSRIDDYRSVLLNDVNNDGKVDFIARTNNILEWYENIDNEGTFSTAKIISYGLYEKLKLKDMDEDGDTDIVAKVKNFGIVWFENVLNYPTIFGFTFFDENENKKFDRNEIGLNVHKITLDPTSLSTYSNDAGKFKFYVENGNYLLSYIDNENWRLTTDSTQYQVEINGNAVTNKNFGFYPINAISAVNTYLSSTATRCGFEVNYWLDYINEGTRRESGQIKLAIDDSVDFVSSSPEPDRIDGDTLYWDFVDLPPSYQDRVILRLQMPGVEQIGDTILMRSSAYTLDNNNDLILSGNDDNASEIRCAYDPNDKLVSPNRNFNEVLFDETLIYTVRFQNTGTDTAFNVVIKDQLDANLDWSTFTPITASHSYDVTISDGGLLEFSFRDILLPDSLVNEPASHGFLKYSIEPKSGLSENTIIENTADIYFDFNPPIVTNTTESKLVSQLTTSVSTLNLNNQIEIKLYPNPFKDHAFIEVNGIGYNERLNLTLYDLMGKPLGVYNFRASEKLKVTRDLLPSGMYYYQIQSNQRRGEQMASGKLLIH